MLPKFTFLICLNPYKIRYLKIKKYLFKFDKSITVYMEGEIL